MAVATSSWELAEGRVFDYMTARIENSEKGRNAFISDELPPQVYDSWAFAITGGDSAATEFVAECRTRTMGAVIKGRYRERSDLQKLEQQVRNMLPVWTGIESVQKVAQTGEAIQTRATIDPTGTGRLVQFYAVEIPLEVVFNNIP